MSSSRSDRIAGGTLALVAVAYTLEARRFHVGFIADPIGPRAFPYLLGTVLLVLSFWLMARPSESDAVWPRGGFWWRWTVVSLGMILYALVLDAVGFPVSTTLLVGWLALSFEGKVLKSLTFALAFSALTYLVFRYLLGVALPSGAVFETLLTALG